MNFSVENKNKYSALAFTIGFHAILFLLFIFIVFITPIPPFDIKPIPEITLDLGMEGLGNADAGGSGQNDNDLATTEKATKAPVLDESESAFVTDETETVVSVKSHPKREKVTKAETPKIEEPKASSELLSALAVLKSKRKHEGKGEGTGNTGGSGTGDEHGVGDGKDTGHGDKDPGYNSKGGYDLKGRLLLRKPERMSGSQEEGVVVVEIIVDETGKVIKATPGQRGSTTTNSNLYAKARQAALSAKFNSSPEDVKEQRGTYTFVFLLE